MFSRVGIQAKWNSVLAINLNVVLQFAVSAETRLTFRNQLRKMLQHHLRIPGIPFVLVTVLFYLWGIPNNLKVPGFQDVFLGRTLARSYHV
jgi:hypothetical protein